VVELIALDDAEIKYSTAQNWYPGDAEGHGGILNFVTKRGDCRGARSKISWTLVETGSAITWKYPSCILRSDHSQGEFYSIPICNGRQQVDSGTKMIHLGNNTSSRIISKGIAAGRSNNTYRGLVTAHRKAKRARNFTNCDSLLIGDQCGAHTVPYIEAKNASTVFAHEASSRRSPRPCCSTADSAACDDYRRNEPAHNVIPPAQGITLHSFTLAIAKSFANFGEVLIRRVVTIIRIAS
jgi:Fe-S cluster assembly protein SufB